SFVLSSRAQHYCTRYATPCIEARHCRIGFIVVRGDGMEVETGIDGNISNAQKKLGGRVTATYKKISKTAGARPRMISDAVRHDLMDGIGHFISQGSMSFSSFRDV
ncbi:unnamed protein product, partial [Ectocarpus sp. 13 AM-2016]